MEIISTRDATNLKRVRPNGAFDGLVEKGAAALSSEGPVALLVSRCIRCTHERYCSPSCQSYECASQKYFHVERVCERGESSWERLSPLEQRMCDQARKTWEEQVACRVQPHRRSQYALAFVHHHGRGVRCDMPKALEYYRLAAKQGVGEAQNALAKMYRDGAGVHPSDCAAVKLFRQAAKHSSHPEAYYNMGKLYQEGRGGLGQQWTTTAAEDGRSKHQGPYSNTSHGHHHLHEGSSRLSSSRRSKGHYASGSSHSPRDPFPHHDDDEQQQQHGGRGRIERSGNVEEVSVNIDSRNKNGGNLFVVGGGGGGGRVGSRGAKERMGESSSSSSLAVQQREEMGFAILQRARTLDKEAARAGTAVAVCHLTGRGIPMTTSGYISGVVNTSVNVQDSTTTTTLAAAEQQQQQQQQRSPKRGVMMAAGRSLPPLVNTNANPPENLTNPGVMNNSTIGRRGGVHGGGDGGDEALAVSLLKQAAEKGYRRAQFNLGLLYSKEEQARRLARRRKRRHDTKRNSIAGGEDDSNEDGCEDDDNDDGLLEPSDYECAKWWRRAADQGHARAQYALALRFMQGRFNEAASQAKEVRRMRLRSNTKVKTPTSPSSSAAKSWFAFNSPTRSQKNNGTARSARFAVENEEEKDEEEDKRGLGLLPSPPPSPPSSSSSTSFGRERRLVRLLRLVSPSSLLTAAWQRSTSFRFQQRRRRIVVVASELAGASGNSNNDAGNNGSKSLVRRVFAPAAVEEEDEVSILLYLPKHEGECVELLQRAAAQRHGGALAALGTAHEQGRGGLRRDRHKAMELYHSAIDEGYEPARKHLTRLRAPKSWGELMQDYSASNPAAGGASSSIAREEVSVVSESPFWPNFIAD